MNRLIILTAILITSNGFSKSNYEELYRASFQVQTGQSYSSGEVQIARAGQYHQKLRVFSPTAGCRILAKQLWIKRSANETYQVPSYDQYTDHFMISGHLHSIFVSYQPEAYPGQVCDIVVASLVENRTGSNILDDASKAKGSCASFSMGLLTTEGYQHLKPQLDHLYVELDQLEDLITEGTLSEVYERLNLIKELHEQFSSDFFHTHADCRNSEMIEAFLVYQDKTETLLKHLEVLIKK